MHAPQHNTPTHDQPWEQRYFWQDDALVRIEWWADNRPVPAGPQTPPARVQRRDYCYRHGTQIYADLGCQVCRQLPADARRRRRRA